MSIGIDYKALMYDITTIAGSEAKIDKFLMKSFSLIGHALGLERICYFTYDIQSHQAINLYDWVQNSQSESPRLQAISFGDVKWLYHKLISKNVLRYDDVAEIPNPEVRKVLLEQQIKSVMVVPVYVNDKLNGFVAFNQSRVPKSWSDQDEYILYTLAIMISQGVKEKLLEEVLNREHQQLLTLIDNIGGLSYAIDIETYRIVYANKELKNLYDNELEGQICYEVLQGKDWPCTFCTNKYILDSDEPYCWEYYNEKLDKDFFLVDRLIKLPDGKRIRFEIGFDVTEQKQSKRLLHKEKELLRVTLLSIGDGVITTDNDCNITMMNKAAEKITGWKHQKALHRPLSQIYKILDDKDCSICENLVERALKSEQFVKSETNSVLLAKDNTEVFISESAAPIRDNEKQTIGTVLVFRDETENVKRENKIRHLSTRDSLTGLYNRGYFEQIIVQHDLPENYPLSLIVGDVNGLKLTNDVFGHDQGDILLKTIAGVIEETCQDSGFVARWGGDEFVALLLNTTTHQAQSICQEIKDKCHQPEQYIWPYSISLGYATVHDTDQDIIVAFKHAEDFMYKKKLLDGKVLRSTIIGSMRQKLYQKTFETQDHIADIVRTSSQIGAYFKLSAGKMNQLKTLAEYHDIGKISIDKKILLKQGKLTKDEWNKLKRHPEIGYRIVKAVSELSIIAEELLCLRERWDGNGYPQGLTQDSIPLLSRIVAVSDAYHSMLSDRPYRPALSQDQAAAELQRNAGKQFDPQIVEILLGIITSDNQPQRIVAGQEIG